MIKLFKSASFLSLSPMIINSSISQIASFSLSLSFLPEKRKVLGDDFIFDSLPLRRPTTSLRHSLSRYPAERRAHGGEKASARREEIKRLRRETTDRRRTRRAGWEWGKYRWDAIKQHQRRSVALFARWLVSWESLKSVKWSEREKKCLSINGACNGVAKVSKWI